MTHPHGSPTPPDIDWAKSAAELTAGDIMTREVVSVLEDAKLWQIAELMASRRISALPVVNLQGHVLGIISETDLINEEKRRVQLPRTMLFGVFPVPENVADEAFEQGDALTARDLMTHPAFTLPDDTPAQTVAEELVGRGYNHIPITRDGKLVGLIARGDILRMLRAFWKIAREE